MASLLGRDDSSSRPYSNADDRTGRLYLNPSFKCLIRNLLITTGVFGGFAVSGFSIGELDHASYKESVRPFLDTYCIRCHGPEKQKGERRFDELSYPISDDDALIDFQDMLDLLNLGDMPPEDEKQPTDAERQGVINWLTQAVDHAYASRTEEPGETILRRLSHREYLNTVHDLFQMDMSMFDPTESFPGDRMVEHLDNVGETLVTSGYLLRKYMTAADAIVEKALPRQERPEAQTWRFNGDFEQQSELNRRHQRAHGQRYLNVYEAPNTVRHFGSYGPLLAFSDGVPYGGIYEIRVLAEAVNRFHDFNRRRIPNDPAKPMLMRIVPGHRRFGALHLPQPYEPDLGTFELSDDGPEWYTVRTWLDEGFAPRFTYLNGSMNIRPGFREASNVAKKRMGEKMSEEDRNADYMVIAIKHGVIPHIRIHEVEISGPFYDQWPTSSWQAVIGEERFNPKKTKRILKRFADKAYRRPASKDELASLMKVVSSRSESGHEPFEALKDGLKAALCSPAFLYLDEPADQKNTYRLSDYALASRLSYFLWGSMPDDELFTLARKGKLSDIDVLNEQILRMLESDRSNRFVNGFLDSWLTLRSLGDTPPDRGKFEHYYAANLESAMRRETELFTRHALDENQSVLDFLDADYTFINESLADLYGIEDVEGGVFRKVSLSDRRRGGLLGQASVLTVTANGVDTSPVLRGVWLLENLLGTPPSPPPPDVEPLDPDIRGAKTIRDQLQKHRTVTSCNECHRKIDPLGFALENFDAIGQWRNSYEEGGDIDASGSLPNGSSFHDIVDFKKALLEREGEFVHALTEKMLAYALGRRIEILDRPAIDDIVESLEEQGGGFKDLVTLIAMSDTFAQP